MIKNFKTTLMALAALILMGSTLASQPAQAASYPNNCPVGLPDIYSGKGAESNKTYLVFPPTCSNVVSEGWRIKFTSGSYNLDIPFAFGVTNTIEWTSKLSYADYTVYPASNPGGSWGGGVFHITYRTDGLTPAPQIYDRNGMTYLNGRSWYTACEPYSQTSRCRTDIVNTTTVYAGGRYIKLTSNVFNNLTYQKSARSLWKNNPIGGYGKVGYKGTWGGGKWRVECDTPNTGGGACRSYYNGTFNSIVLFN